MKWLLLANSYCKFLNLVVYEDSFDSFPDNLTIQQYYQREAITGAIFMHSYGPFLPGLSQIFRSCPGRIFRFSLLSRKIAFLKSIKMYKNFKFPGFSQLFLKMSQIFIKKIDGCRPMGT